MTDTKRAVDDGTGPGWLRWLFDDLSDFYWPTGGGSYYRGQQRCVRRQITAAEFKRVKRTVREEGLIVVPHNAGMGFNFGIAIWEAPTYPGLPATFVAALEGEHFGLRFAEAWATLSPLSHNPKNAALLAQFGFEPLKDKSHYDY